MTKLSGVEQYSASDLKVAGEKSEALQRYFGQRQLSPTSPGDELRLERNRHWIDCSLSTLFKKNSAEDVCRYWSEQADLLLKKTFVQFFDQEKYALFALGKLGANELNLSSDVDLLILCAEETSESLTALRAFQKILTENTSFGFVFRVDFDLRPGGKHGPLIPTIEQFKDYYGNYGETWERLALVRLRAIAGEKKIIDEAYAFTDRFCYRRHLDFTLLEDLKLLRKKIHAEYWKRSQDNQIDLKLGVGGIRDIELFVHALLVIHGGKNPSLRDKSTTQALQKIKSARLLPANECDFLLSLYWELRELENQVQIKNDSQTHLLPSPPKELLPKLQKCSLLVSGLIGELPEVNPKTDDALASLPIELQEHWSEIIEIHTLSRNKERDEQTRLIFLQKFFAALQRHRGNIPQALGLLKDFIRATRAKASFFALLVREDKLLEELAWIFGQSPYLAKILCYRPELLDSFVYRAQELSEDDMQLLLEQLVEKKQLSEIINGSAFLRTKNVINLCKNLSSTADEILKLLSAVLKKEYPSEISLLALGKWGGEELGLCSDLDFILITPREPTEADFKFAKRLISRLTESHKGGSIYPIDMRLRPSGSSGPLVICATNLKDYLLNSAAVWERQAYLKARWIGPVLVEIPTLLIKKISAADLAELERIRTELLPKKAGLDLKYSAGGLIDIEFAAQIICLGKLQPIPVGNTAALIQLAALPESLLQNYLLLRQYEQLLQLITTESRSDLSLNHESFHSLATLLNFSDASFSEHISLILSKNIQILDQLDPRRLSR